MEQIVLLNPLTSSLSFTKSTSPHENPDVTENINVSLVADVDNDHDALLLISGGDYARGPGAAGPGFNHPHRPLKKPPLFLSLTPARVEKTGNQMKMLAAVTRIIARILATICRVMPLI